MFIVPTVIWICKLSTDIHFNFYQLGKSISAQYHFKTEKKLFIRLIIYQIFSHSVHKGNASFSLCFMELLQGTKVKVSWIHVIRLVNLKVKTVTYNSLSNLVTIVWCFSVLWCQIMQRRALLKTGLKGTSTSYREGPVTWTGDFWKSDAINSGSDYMSTFL